MIAAILLSAGLSVRFGSPKVLADINGSTVIRHLQDTLLKSCLDEIIIVLGGHFEKIKPNILNHRKIRIVYNKDYNLGQMSSLKAGLQCVPDASLGFMVFVADTPLIKAETVDFLADFFKEKRPKILIPTCRGKKGHPPVFDIACKNLILSLGLDTGLNAFEHSHVSDTVLCAVEDEGILKSFNTPEEFKSL